MSDFGSFVLLFVLLILLAEPLDSPGSVNQLLLPREEGMAFGADIDLEAGLCGPGVKFLSTGAAHCDLFVFGVNSLFHLYSSLHLQIGRGIYRKTLVKSSVLKFNGPFIPIYPGW